ncbi:MAG: TolC family protein [Polyangia bacterium]|jgi:outer membrane protein
MKTRLASLLMIGAALYARPGRAAGGALADAQEGHEGHEGHEGEDVRPMDVVVTAQIVTLTEAMRSARAHQPALEMARGNVVTAWGQADQVRAALLPQLNGNASYSRGTNNYVPSVGGTTPGAQTISSSFTTYARWYSSLTLSQMIYDFGETINKWQAAVAAAQAMDQTVSITEFQIDYNTRFAFFTARAAKELVGVARDNLANQEKHLAQVKGFVEVGTHPEIDLTQAKADRATAELQLITAETNYATAKANLNQAMGVERSIDYELSDEDSPPVAGEDGAVEALVGEADHDRPEMRNLYLNLKSQELTLRSAHDQIWPQLTLSGNLNDAGPDLDRTAWNFSGIFSISVPFIQGGAIHAAIKQAEGQITQAKSQVDTERLQVRLDVEQARLGIRSAKGSIVAGEDALANSRDRLRLAEGRYRAGAGSIIELGDAQVALVTAAAQLVQARYQLFIARAQLVKALARK